MQGAAQYGMEPGEFIQVLDKNGQIPGMIAEVARVKALAVVLDKAKVVDSKGKDVDVSAFTATALGGENDDSEEITASDVQGTNDGHEHGAAKDGHGRKPGHEHYGHDHK